MALRATFSVRFGVPGSHQSSVLWGGLASTGGYMSGTLSGADGRSPKDFHGLLTQPSPSLVGEAYLRGEGWVEGWPTTCYPEGVAL